MTLLHEFNAKDACAAGCSSTGASASGVVGVGGISCCTTAASSEISIDESFTQQNNNIVVNNNLPSTINKIDLISKYEQIELDFPRCQEINIDFENVRYSVSSFNFAERKFVTKEILHGISGSFRSGELTAIMGPSGSGKSTLLNVMSGFRATGVSGNINVNGKPVSTHAQSFRELSCYIHQNDLLRPQLTVCETMMLSAHLKLGFNVSNEHKLNLVKHILSLLGLEHRLSVFAGKLSGGQKKRLAIALELISNPPVLYLDEPTTGLDSSSTSQCVGLLKKLASQGHTIVCTIHQPSALIFEMFDKLYTVVDGNCMYHGPVRELIPFLNDQGLICPSYHNPADFLMEVAVGEHERDLNKLIDAARKKYDVYQTLVEQNNTTSYEWKKYPTPEFPAYDYVKPDATIDEQRKSQPHLLQSLSLEENDKQKKHPLPSEMRIQSASFLRQYILLLQRILVCARRNYFLLLARLLSHIVIGVVFGYLYMNVGDKATTVLGNYVYLYGSTLLLVYTGKMAVVLTFPLEIGMLTREHFNRWYSLGPYFLSLLSFEIPFQSFCVILYMSISVYLTGNDSDASFRIYYFVFLGVMVSLSAQAWGFFVGATLPTKLAVFLGPILAVLFSVFGFCSRYIDITPIFRWMWHISYFRAGFHGSLNAFYGMDRPLLSCPDSQMYCHFRSPKVFLNYMMISDVNMSDCVWLMSTVIAVMHLLTLLTLWHKLNKR